MASRRIFPECSTESFNVGFAAKSIYTLTFDPVRGDIFNEVDGRVPNLASSLRSENGVQTIQFILFKSFCIMLLCCYFQLTHRVWFQKCTVYIKNSSVGEFPFIKLIFVVAKNDERHCCTSAPDAYLCMSVWLFVRPSVRLSVFLCPLVCPPPAPSLSTIGDKKKLYWWRILDCI